MSNDRIDDSAFINPPPDLDSLTQSLTAERDGLLNTNTSMEQNTESTALPDKFQGKSVTDVVKMYQELESTLGRQGSELGELRKLADTFIQSPTGTTQPVEQTQHRQLPSVNLEDLSEPEKVQAVLNSTLAPLQDELNMLRRERLETKLSKDHPDYIDVVKDGEFQRWVLESDLRKEMFVRANSAYDFNAANELFATWKQLKGIRNTTASADAATREAAFSQGAMATGGATDAAPKTIYRRTDLVALKSKNPALYNQLEPQIRLAYAENRVR